MSEEKLHETAQARSHAISEALRDMLDQVRNTMGGLSYDDIVGGLATFLVQMLVEGHILAREHGSTETLDDIAERLDDMCGELQQVVVRRLRQYWEEPDGIA